MKIHFRCPVCRNPVQVTDPVADRWHCPCGHIGTVNGTELVGCIVCGNTELYKKKDFPHWLGLSILTVACVGFLAGHALYMPWLAWTILIGSALFDGLLYIWVRDVVICYRCDAQYRSCLNAGHFEPFDLGVAERYRQEQIRRAHFQAENKSLN